MTYVARTVKRFWSKVDRLDSDECWIWKGTIALPNPCGMRYGSFGVSEGGKSVAYRAHRFAWMLANGEIPEEFVVMHTCDVPLCVNPSHLRSGTQAENQADMARKGRQAKGQDNGRAKLTPEQVIEIRQSDKSIADLAREYGLHHKAIGRIVKGETWRHLL